MRRLQLLPFIIILLAFAGCKQEDEALPKYELIWTESFDGTSLDTDKWEYMLGDGCHLGPDLCGWGNSELQYYTDREANVKVENGKLKITARYEPNYDGTGYNYTSGRIRTRPDLNVTWKYGKFEALIKLPSAQSVWPAFWMLPKLANPWPIDGEIDIMESKHENPEDWAGTIHYQNSDCNCHDYKGASANSFGNLSTQFVKYAVEWEEDEIRWFVNDREQGKVMRSSTPGWPFDGVKPFYLLLNVAVGGPGTGYTGGISPNSSHYPTTMEVEYVKVYKKAY